MFARKQFVLVVLAGLALLSLAPSLYLPLVRKDGAPPTLTPSITAYTATVTPSQTATLTPEPTATNTQQPGPCNCTGPDLDCGDFGSHNEAQTCFNYCFPKYGDIFNLDGDGDGLVCESLP